MSASQSLPAQPSLEHLKNEAKALLKAHHEKDRAVCSRLRALPALAAASDQEILAADLSLHDAQHAVAKSYGFEKWADLKAHVEWQGMEQRIRKQYADPTRVSARAALYRHFSKKPPFGRRVFDQYADIPAEADILEIGSGPGSLWLANADRIPPGWRILVTDFSEGMVTEAQKRLASLGREFQFRAMDAEGMDLPPASYDAVLANHVLPNVRDVDAALGGIARILKPDGRLYASTNGANHLIEMQQLVLELARTIAGMEALAGNFGHSHKFVGRFGLDTAPAMLRRHFQRVEIRPLNDVMAADRAQPMIDYLMSCKGADEIPPEGAAQVAEAVRRKVEAEGPMRVTADAGVLVAWNE